MISALRSSSSRWLWLLLGWTVFGVVQALLRGALGVRSEVSFYNTVIQVIALAVGWALLTPVVGAWHRAASGRGWGLPLLVGWHVPLLVAAALAITVLRRQLVLLLGGQVAVPFDVTLAYFADLTIASYLAAIWASRALDSLDALVAQERRTSALRTQLMASQMEYLDLQLRPHFLFNALGSIAELAHEAPKTAARMLQNVIALLESAVSRRGSGLVSLDEEVRALSPYLEIQRLRFADWLVIDLDVDAQSRTAFLPPFVLQPLVENAVHHGLMRRTERGRISIVARVAQSRLQVTVTDNGAGLNAATYQESRGMGLANIRGRLSTFYGADSSLELRSEAEGGTTARLDIPLRHANPAQPVARDAPTAHAQAAGSAVIEWVLAHPTRALLIGWAAVALFRIQHSLGYMWLRDRFTAEAFAGALRYDIVVAIVWLALTPLVIAFSRAIPLRGAGVPRRMAVHAVAAGVFAFSHTFLTRVVAGSTSQALWEGLDTELYSWNVAIYAILLLGAHYQTFESWLRERESMAQRLRVELQEARLNRVMLELRPTMLFDVLRSLVTLVETDRRRAESRLVELSEFLRATLDAMRHHEVPLAQELDGARAYVRLLAIATVPGVTLHIDEERGAALEPVPNGILRAAIDAVIGSASDAPGAVHLAIRRLGEGLRIAAWHAPTARAATGALTEQITGYLEHGLTEATWSDGQLLLRT
ncbi:MAG TPA: histidine kinase [Gemmatimonadaceae bacterium]|nr:histidine kinase [Gemmatimonadaceae bacterium]